MPVLHCSICGQLLPHDATSREHGSTVCGTCITKLDAHGEHTNRTTIMRPVASERIGGTPIISTPNPSESKKSEKFIIPLESKGSSRAEIDPTVQVSVTGDSAENIKKKFGSYEIICEISRGSFGVVYKAGQQGLDRIVALKVLLAGVHASAEAVARFHREAKAVARLKHENIVPIYDIGTHDGHHYFAMEFIEGDALSTLIGKRAVNTSHALEIAEALADALESAHNAGIIHRDIKPSNILIDSKGRPHITDFGLAKQVDLDTKYTMSGTTLGTPAYMPPEQARGEVEKIDARSDVYAIGAVLYEMLTGQTPFGGRSLLEVVVAVINEPVQPPRQINPKIHRDVQTIVMKCLEKDPRLRYASAAELRDDIRRFRSGETIRARPAGLLRLGVRFIQRHSLIIGAITAASIVAMFSFYNVQTTIQEKEKIVEANEKLVKEKKEEEQKKQAVLVPVWWFPPKDPADLKTEEQRRLYKIPEGRENSFKGLVKGREVWDLKPPEGTQPEKVERLPGDHTLISPDDSRFSVDIEADITVNWPDTTRKLRVGLQSISERDDGVPLIAEFSSGSARIIGPTDLYNHTARPHNPKTGPKLEIKAEKDISELPAGEYRVYIRREGTLLSFQLIGPVGVTASIQIKDLNLSNWIFKYTQLSLRNPPVGLEVLAAEVRQKIGGDEPPGFRHFREGEYSVAETELKFIATEKDPFNCARALYQLGQIQEVCSPTAIREQGNYTDALGQLDLVPRTDPRWSECARIERELRIRRLVGFARNHQWQPAFLDELNQGWYEAKIGEPLAWELTSAIELALKDLTDDALKEGEKPPALQALLSVYQHLGVAPGSARLGKLAADLGAKLRIGGRYDELLSLHQSYPTPALRDAFFASALLIARDALNAASTQADNTEQLHLAMQFHSYITKYFKTEKDNKSLNDLAADMVAAAMRGKKYSEAASIYSDMPSASMLVTVSKEIEAQAKDLSDADFYAFLSRFFPILMVNLPPEQSANDRFLAALDKLGQEIINSGKLTKLRRLHEALRGQKTKMDSRLASSFASALQRLAQSGSEGADEKALELLKYCAEHVSTGDPKIREAVCAMAEAKAPRGTVDETGAYNAILTYQHVYPTPELMRTVTQVMRNLVMSKPRRYADAVLFFSQARVEFGLDAWPLTPLVLSALENIPSPEQRTQLLRSIWTTVHDEYSRQQMADADRRWMLDYGDIQLAMNQWEYARDRFNMLLDSQDVEPGLQAMAGLRLLVMEFTRPGIAPATETLARLRSLDLIPDEFRMAIRCLSNPDRMPLSDIEAQLKTKLAANIPLQLRNAEWDLIRGIRLRMDGNFAESGTRLQGAARDSSASRIWVNTIATQLISQRPIKSPDEDPRRDTSPDKAQPKPGTPSPEKPLPNKTEAK